MLLGPLCHVPSPMSHLALDLRSSFRTRTVSPTHVSIRIWDLERRSGRTLGPVWDPTVGVSRRHESRRTRTFQSSHFARDIRSTASERPSWRQEHRSRTQNAPREWGVFFCFFFKNTDQSKIAEQFKDTLGPRAATRSHAHTTISRQAARRIAHNHISHLFLANAP